ncbi:MAG: hypothetical protein M1819_004577 [Sarea resinae]|nr:MAG: hypothetical protein M1819_006819 [Sarea resinae]KAI9832033.1 MAG: hypothetical protein M1819_004577 [Sarea resinae]
MPAHTKDMNGSAAAHAKVADVANGVRVSKAYEINNANPRNCTDAALASAIHARYPHLILTITSIEKCDLIAYAKAGHAVAELDNSEGHPLVTRNFVATVRRFEERNKGDLDEHVIFAKYQYRWGEHDLIVYCAEGQEGPWGDTNNHYVLSHPQGDENVYGNSSVAEKLILDASVYTAELHEEVLVYDEGQWNKDKNVWREMQTASWDDVILKDEIKHALTDDIQSFFDKKAIYRKFAVPWKRGIIFHGPPGNGKTVSIKAMMNTLSRRPGADAIPILYVKTFETCSSCYGPEVSIRKIFMKARATAPCLLIFEDVDSLVTDDVRSYFLNEVDGLASNDGILMVGTTNHLERLDAGISKRPSRFDRTYLFDNPNGEERVQYAEYWREKLASNPSITFPAHLSQAISNLTADLSFAFMKEAFVATLLLIVTRGSSDTAGHNGDAAPNGTARINGNADSKTQSKGNPSEDGEDDPSLSHLILWQEMRKQVKALRASIAAEEELEKSKGEGGKADVAVKGNDSVRSWHDTFRTVSEMVALGVIFQTASWASRRFLVFGGSKTG